MHSIPFAALLQTEYFLLLESSITAYERGLFLLDRNEGDQGFLINTMN